MADTTAPSGFDRLWSDNPWPDSPPIPGAPLVGREAAGFDLVAKALADLGKSHPVIVEIGGEFGGSTRRFMDLPGTYVVSVDPWPDTYAAGSFPELREYLGGPGAMFALFQSFTFEHRDRLATVRGSSPAGLLLIHDAGVEVDLVYVDGDHRYDVVLRDLTAASTLFPNASLSGSDWLFNPVNAKYEGIRRPVQTAVRRFAAVNDMHVDFDGDAWLVDPSRPFNLERPVPRFSHRATAGERDLRENDVKGRMTALETAVTELTRGSKKDRKALERIEELVQPRPARKIVGTVRSLLGGKSR